MTEAKKPLVTFDLESYDRPFTLSDLRKAGEKIKTLTSHRSRHLPPTNPFLYDSISASQITATAQKWMRMMSLYQPIIPPKFSFNMLKMRTSAKPKLTAMQLKSAEQTWVPGIVLVVDENLCIPSGEHIDVVAEWVKDHCVQRVNRTFTCQRGAIETFRYTFDSEIEKVMFKLRWC